MALVILDIATTAWTDAGQFLEEPTAPANYKDPAKIADYISHAKVSALLTAGLDLDLCRVTALGFHDEDGATVRLAKTEADEAGLLAALADIGDDILVTFNGFRFDLPVLMRRCLYLGLPVPTWSLDKYRSPHIDLWSRLSFNGSIQVKSLSWYVRRFGWTDLVKPLTGAEEADVPNSGRWDELAQSVRHDLEATRRIASKLGFEVGRV